MEISKKDLLEETKISYGQLYRWKRKGLIPDSWFIKRSSYTGQETFFPKEEILERVNKIIELKDMMPLEEIREYLNGDNYFKVYKKHDINSLFKGLDNLNENVTYYDLITLEIVNQFKELTNDISKISDSLSKEVLDYNFYYLKDKVWVISKDIITNVEYKELNLKETVKLVNKKLSDGGVV